MQNATFCFELREANVIFPRYEAKKVISVEQVTDELIFMCGSKAKSDISSR